MAEPSELRFRRNRRDFDRITGLKVENWFE
jgi:predicted nucleic acid-binding protein